MVFTPKDLTWLAIAKETAWGTPATVPTFFTPFKDSKYEDVNEFVKDQGIRGALAATYNISPGVKRSTMDIGGEAFPDALGLYLLAILGTDTVSGTSPYSHTFKLARTAQPPSLTHFYYDGTSIRQLGGHIASELQLKWAAKSALEVSFKSEGKSSAIFGTPTTPTPTATIPFIGWEFAATLNGTANLNLVGFDISLKRKLYVQHAANNSQDPSAIIAGPLEVTGKATFDKADDTELNMFLSNTQPSLVLTGTQPGTSYQLAINMQKCAFMKDQITGKEVVQGDVQYEAIDNTTNGGPVAITLANAVVSY